MTGLRSNSMNFAPVSDVVRGRNEACPLAIDPARLSSLTELGELERMVFVRLRDRMRLVRSDTGDFSSTEIARVKELAQIYLDVSTKLAPDDFAKDLKKLALEPECRTCPERSRCPTCHRPSTSDVFTRDEAVVRGIVRTLEGDVLDVGAGLAPYAAELTESVRAGKTRYFALDPDAARLALIGSRHPWAVTERGTLDDIDSSRRFAHVLLLRSYNHLPAPEAALARAANVIDVGGTLLIVDDVAFGLVRSHEQRERAEHSGAAFEHYRNASSEDVLAAVSGLPLRLAERCDVDARGSNQWLLRFERVEEIR